MAKIIVHEYNGEFPEDEHELTKLPGVGTYTARALLVFAFGKDLALVDTNIRQIITHFFYHDVKQPSSVVHHVADQLVPNGNAWAWHQALMDYGAMEMSKVKGNPSERLGTGRKNVKGGIIPFRDTNRFYRGKIMDLLREMSYEYDDMVEYIFQTYRKDQTFMDRILRSLEKDGLIEFTNHHISLPK